MEPSLRSRLRDTLQARCEAEGWRALIAQHGTPLMAALTWLRGRRSIWLPRLVFPRTAGEFTHLGEPWLEHDERYRRSAEFLQVLRKIWTEDEVDFRGDFYRIHDFTLKPKPLNSPVRPNPEIFQGGNSSAARRNGGRHADWYFSNGKDFDGVTEQIVDVREHARDAGREVKFGLNAFIIARDTEGEAKEVLREIIAKANRPAVEGFGAAVQQAGNATGDKRGMWADSTFEDLVQYNDGFRTKLIGTPEQIAERIAAYRKRGVDLILGGFLHFQEEIEYFGARVLPLVRDIEAAERDSLDPAVLAST